MIRARSLRYLVALVAMAVSVASLAEAQHGDHGPRLSDVALPPQVDLVPLRPRPLLELGDRFYSTGPIGSGFKLWTGAVWQPSLLVFGEFRTAVQAMDTGPVTTSEWANRLDLFANLQLSGTERLFAGWRPLDSNGRFTSYQFQPEFNDGWDGDFNGRLTHLFFEGDFGEIFPELDRDDSSANDTSFSVGRQPVLLQDGLLVNDRMDALVVTQNTAFAKHVSNLRVTGIAAWNAIGRDDNLETTGTQLFGLSVEGDRKDSTISMDALWVHDEDGNTDAVYAGLGSVQRFGRWNTTARAATSYPLHGESASVSQGTLLFGELSTAPTGTDNVAYVNAFFGINEFASAARAPEVGGPLGRVGILYEAVGLGRYGAALGNRADHSYGGAIGYQIFLDETRKQLILELGSRNETEGPSTGAVAIGGSYQQAFGQHTIFRLDAFVAGRENLPDSAGARIELRFKF